MNAVVDQMRADVDAGDGGIKYQEFVINGFFSSSFIFSATLTFLSEGVFVGF